MRKALAGLGWMLAQGIVGTVYAGFRVLVRVKLVLYWSCSVPERTDQTPWLTPKASSFRPLSAPWDCSLFWCLAECLTTLVG